MAPRGEGRQDAVVSWQGRGNLNTNPPGKLTAEERDNACIVLLRSKQVSDAELKPIYTVPQSMATQADVINEKNGQLCALYTKMARNRRLYFKSWLLGGDTKQALGDRKGIINMLSDDATAVDKLFEEIKRDGGHPVKMPKVFKNEPDLTHLKR